MMTSSGPSMALEYSILCHTLFQLRLPQTFPTPTYLHPVFIIEVVIWQCLRIFWFIQFLLGISWHFGFSDSSSLPCSLPRSWWVYAGPHLTTSWWSGWRPQISWLGSVLWDLVWSDPWVFCAEWQIVGCIVVELLASSLSRGRAWGLLSWPSPTQALAGGVNLSETWPVHLCIPCPSLENKGTLGFLHYTLEPKRGLRVLAQASLLPCHFQSDSSPDGSKAKAPVLAAFPSIYPNPQSQDFSPESKKQIFSWSLAFWPLPILAWVHQAERGGLFHKLHFMQ